MDRLTSMEVFAAVADAGSFTTAAGQVGLSPQMVARHVGALEARLGGRLIQRTTRRQTLTVLGEAYLERCRAVLEQIAEADGLGTSLNAAIKGRLRVTAPVAFGGRALVPFVRKFLREHGSVEIDLVLTNRIVDLIGEGCDVAFRIGPLADSGLASRPIAPQQLIACASPLYLAENPAPRIPADLAGHECLGRPYWLADTDRTWRFTRAGEVFEVEVQSRWTLTEAEALLAAGLEGAGIVLGAAAVLRPALDDGSLVAVLPDYLPPSRPMHLVFAHDRHPPMRIRRFIDEAVQAFGP